MFCVALFSTSYSHAAASASFTLHQLADGVYATERNESAGLMFDANNVFLICDSDVVVVDSNISPDSTAPTDVVASSILCPAASVDPL